jgi:hypothetical protein
MPTRIEDLESRFFRSKSSISEIFYEALESFLAWAGPLVSNFQIPFIQRRGQLYARNIALKSRNAAQHCVALLMARLLKLLDPRV